MITFKNIILYIWQFPQHLIALCILLYHKARKAYCKKVEVDGVEIYRAKHVGNAGVSLGNYIFIDIDRILTKNTVLHEHGHQFQSLYLGPLYLIIIGIPSAIGNIVDRIDYRIHKKSGGWYYKQPWEAWADKLGGVKRNY